MLAFCRNEHLAIVDCLIDNDVGNAVDRWLRRLPLCLRGVDAVTREQVHGLIHQREVTYA
jgi:hypothetical protein